MSTPSVPFRRVLQRAAVVSSLVAIVGGAVAGGEPPPASVSLPPEAVAVVRQMAIQHNGRRKPFESFARETLELIAGSQHVGQADPVVTAVSIIASPEPWQAVALITVPFRPLREALGMDPHASHTSYNDLLATRRLMRMLPPIVQKQQRDEKLTMLEQETMDLYERFVTISSLFEQDLVLVPPPADGGTVTPGQGGGSWLPVFGAAGYPQERRQAFRQAWTDFLEAARSGQRQPVIDAAQHLSEVLRAANPVAYPEAWRLQLEVAYHEAAPFRIAWILYLVACLGLLMGGEGWRKLPPAVGGMVLWAAFLTHGTGIGIRVVLGGRPPVSNFFETMLWLPFVAVALALVFDRVYRVRYFGIAASILAALTLLLSERVPLDPSISPVVAVLRSNLWLTVHVLTVVASYGALALATVLAHLSCGVFLMRREAPEALASLDRCLYRVIQVGVVLLAGGIMLGAVWANASWGRYWGWDPKETWALITLLWFLAVLHGRSAGWLKGLGTALGTIGGFFLLLMTYYGVSFYLVGLHSYAGGHAKPVPSLLIAYLVAEVAFLAGVAFTALRRKSLA